MAHVVNGVNLQIMPQWNWIVWALISAIASQMKVARITKPINLAQPALFAAKKATFPENSGIIYPDHPLLILIIIHKDTGNARYTLQGAIAAPRYPTDQIMLLTLNQMIAKYPTTLLMFQLVEICHQHTIHH